MIFTYKTSLGLNYFEFEKYTQFEDKRLAEMVISANKASFEYWAKEFSKKPTCYDNMTNAALIYQHALINMEIKNG